MAKKKKDVCVHGVTQHDDYHDCGGCKEIAKTKKIAWVDKQITHVFIDKKKRNA